MISRLRIINCVVFVLVLLGIEAPLQAQYTFATVTTNNPGPVALNVPSVSLNNAGQVAFISTSGVTSLPQGIYRGTSGGNLENIALIGPSNFTSYQNYVSMNDSGTVAFYGKPATSSYGVFTGNGNTITTIADQTGDLSSFVFGATSGQRAPSINNQGSVAFAVVHNALSSAAIIRQDGDARTYVVQQNKWIDQRSPSINNANQTAFFWNNLTGSGSTYELWRNAESNNTLYATSPDLSIADGFKLNNIGQALLKGNDQVGLNSALYLADGGGNPIFVVGTFQSPFAVLGESSLNDSGTIAFLATLDAGGGGIYTGSDPLTSKVIAIGDALDGSIVTDLLFYREGLNDLGQIAFSAKLEDGRGGIFIASLAAVPEPTTYLLCGLGMAAFGPLVYRRIKSSRQVREKTWKSSSFSAQA